MSRLRPLRDALNVFPWILVFALAAKAGSDLPPNRWIGIQKEKTAARRESAIRYVPEAGAFFLWGFMDADPELLQEQPLMEVPEYDMVEFDPSVGRWRNHLPTDEPEGVPRPDLNIVFDQVTYDPHRHALIDFTGGLTAAYSVASLASVI